MTKHVDVLELLTNVPVSPEPMTRTAKLTHWAELVRKSPRGVQLLHGLQFMHPFDLERWTIRDFTERMGPATALGIAAADPTLQAQGLGPSSSIADALRFFGVTQDEAHAFSCDCGGSITNEEQARRIETLAV